MEIVLDDVNQVATITDWDATDWANLASTVPDAYTLVFQPAVDEATLTAAITNRTLAYLSQTVYKSQTFGNGYVSVPSLISIQTMLPVPAEQPTE